MQSILWRGLGHGICCALPGEWEPVTAESWPGEFQGCAGMEGDQAGASRALGTFWVHDPGPPPGSRPQLKPQLTGPQPQEITPPFHTNKLKQRDFSDK